MKKTLVAVLGLLGVCVAKADYVPVEWIESNTAQAQWLNTGYKPSSTDCIEMKIRFLTTADQAPYGARTGDAYLNSFTAFLAQGQFRFDHGRVGVKRGSIEQDVDYVIKADGATRRATVMKGGATILDVEMGDSGQPADFEGMYYLALLAVNNKGADLAPGSNTGVSYPASARLYYTKIYAENGVLVRDYVPVRNRFFPGGATGVGLYDKVNKNFIGNSGTDGSAFTAGADVADAECIPFGSENAEPQIYEKNVGTGVSVALTAAEVAAAAGKVFVKTGPGTLTVDDVMKDFAGDICIQEGCYEAKSSSALGAAAGKTYVAGGTLVNNQGSCFKSEEIHLFGTGCENHGALWSKVSCSDFARHVVLDGNALITLGGNRLDFRGTTFDMDGKTLTIESSSHNGFRFNTDGSAGTMNFVDMGNIEMRGSGTLWFIRGVSGIDKKTATITMRSGTQLCLWEMTSTAVKCGLVFDPGARLCSELDGNNKTGFQEASARNLIGAEGSQDYVFEMRGIVTNDLVAKAEWSICSKMTGAGGIVGGHGGYLRMSNPHNDFTGGLDIKGMLTDGNPVGGLVTYKNGAIPYGVNAGTVKLTDAILRLLQVDQFDLPDFVAAGRVIVSNDAAVTTCNVRSVKKTGTEELTLVGPFNVQGTAAFDAGTVRLATQVPEGTTSAEEAAKYRASFAGNVAFGPGAVIDVGDRMPYLPIAVPSLTGLPTVKNGALEVASATWTIRKDDILDADDKPLNKPLTLENAALTFPAGPVTIDLSEEDAEALKPLFGTVKCPLIANAAAFSANAFKLSERAKMSGFGLSVQKGQLVFGTPSGTLVIVR